MKMDRKTVKRLLLLGQLHEALNSKEPNMQNHCRGIINNLIALETEQSDSAEPERVPLSPEREQYTLRQKYDSNGGNDIDERRTIRVRPKS